MADITIHDLDANALERLQRRAEANHRSLEEEIKDILTWGVEYIERIQTLTAGMKPMEMPKPFDYAALDERLKEARAFREGIWKEHEEYEQGLPEREAEEKEWEEFKQNMSAAQPSPEPKIEKQQIGDKAQDA